ncbi:phosphotransferase [Pseudonocardia sp. KRD291]|uniref:maltokinase N-terminal cap-like domain-containing protein n=1 Tax=Pseudonocardia sp. KRD291 TaxID=2792007 RepID=UPI0027E3244E|nr:phosphotransferase [Pseudonocardia sp. KRD291]
MSPTEQLADLLPGWLPRQRWFAAKGRSVRSTEVVARTPLFTADDLSVEHVLLGIGFTDDPATQVYQLVVATGTPPADVGEQAVLGPAGDRTVYDGLWDTRVTRWLLAAVRDGATAGDLRFVPEPGATIPDAGHGRVLGAEQSNTSVVWGRETILKIFRRVLPGVNPDLELHRALRAQGSTRVAALRGAVEGVVDGAPATLGMLQDFAADSSEGWPLALETVRATDGRASGETDFGPEAAALGETVAVVHGELLAALGGTTADAGQLAAGWQTRLDAALPQVPELAEHADAIRAVYDAVGTSGAPLPVQRVHGDLHLGQTLRTAGGWLVIDFEGEPSAPLDERARPDSTLRDVAGMLRSFDYAAFHEVLFSPTPSVPPPATPGAAPADSAGAAEAAAEWAVRSRSAFCDGYARGAGSDPREQEATLRAFELDKAVYEAVYETRSRPTWAPIPLASIRRLVGG